MTLEKYIRYAIEDMECLDLKKMKKKQVRDNAIWWFKQMKEASGVGSK